MNIHDALMSTVVHGRNVMDEDTQDYPLGITREQIPDLLKRNESILHIAVVDVAFVPNSTTAGNLAQGNVSFTGRYAVYRALRQP